MRVDIREKVTYYKYWKTKVQRKNVGTTLIKVKGIIYNEILSSKTLLEKDTYRDHWSI